MGYTALISVIHTSVSFNAIGLFFNYYVTEVSHTEGVLLTRGLEKGEPFGEGLGSASVGPGSPQRTFLELHDCPFVYKRWVTQPLCLGGFCQWLWAATSLATLEQSEKLSSHGVGVCRAQWNQQSRQGIWGVPGGSVVNNPPASAEDGSGRSPWSRKWQPTLVFLP